MKYSSSKKNLRATVTLALLEVQEGRSLSTILDYYLNSIEEKNKAFCHQLILGTLRQWHGLKAITLPLLSKPLNNLTVETCLYVGVYQILCTRTASHASISETVDAIKQLGYAALSGLVNAILRKVLLEKNEFSTKLDKAHGLPSWLYKRLKKDWPENLDRITQNLKTTAPVTLRINEKHISRDAYLNKLMEQNIEAIACDYSKNGIQLNRGYNIKELVGFDEGFFCVQDEHAQLCASILPNLNHKTIIDACAAPGGKTSHILEKYQVKGLTALEYDAQRLLKITENLNRLRLNSNKVKILEADARIWHNNEQVDCIILDAPCSATGVIRRHPDIRLLRQPTDILKTIELQKEILNQMWSQVKIDGFLLYITCSILKIENVDQMVSFFHSHANAKESKLNVSWGIEQTYGRQLLPEPNGGDGFYYCLIKKVA